MAHGSLQKVGLVLSDEGSIGNKVEKDMFFWSYERRTSIKYEWYKYLFA